MNKIRGRLTFQQIIPSHNTYSVSVRKYGTRLGKQKKGNVTKRKDCKVKNEE